MTTLEAYRYVAAMATLEKWLAFAERSTPGFRLSCQLYGLIWHDRYLCGDAERIVHRRIAARQEKMADKTPDKAPDRRYVNDPRRRSAA